MRADDRRRHDGDARVPAGPHDDIGAESEDLADPAEDPYEKDEWSGQLVQKTRAADPASREENVRETELREDPVLDTGLRADEERLYSLGRARERVVHRDPRVDVPPRAAAGDHDPHAASSPRAARWRLLRKLTPRFDVLRDTLSSTPIEIAFTTSAEPP